MTYVEGLLAKNERVVVQSRQHWIVLFGSILANGFFFILIIAIAIYASATFLRNLPARGPVTLGLYLFALVPLLALARRGLAWWNEEYLVTNRRVIQAQGVLSKHVIDSSLDKVNDVVLTQSFLGRLFDYGNIEILTASEVGINFFRAIHSPVKFKMAMMEQREEMSGADTPHARGETDIATLIQELDELHHQGVLTDTEYREKKRQLLARM